MAVKNGRILACGYHRAFGLKHAEVMALENLATPGTTLYLTLEPCCHFGKTPPCADLIIARKVERVVMAMADPNPLVNGAGMPQAAGPRHPDPLRPFRRLGGRASTAIT